MNPVIIGVFLLCAAKMVLVATAQSSLPDASLNLKLTAPINTWDEAIPLGNGTMGVLLWGEGNTLRLSLDRGDLWDERPSQKHLAVKERFNWAAMQRMVAENKMGEFNEVFDSNYDYDGPPTKLPAGRVELVLDASQTVESFELNLATAEGIARFTTGPELRAFVNAAIGEAARGPRPHPRPRAPGGTAQDARLREETRLRPAAHRRGGRPALV